MIYISLLNIAIFQGLVLGLIILKSPLFKSDANKYLAYAIFTLSLLLLNLVFEIIDTYSILPYLYFIDNIEWAHIFPVFIFLFITHHLEHPIKSSKKNKWLFLPFIYSVILNVVIDLDKIGHIYNIPNSYDIIVNFLYQIHFWISVLFIPSILIYTYTFIKFSKSVQQKKWLTILWSLCFILFFSWVLAILIDLFLLYDITPFMRLLALLAIFLIHWSSYYGIYKYRLAKDKEGIQNLLNTRLQLHTDNNEKVEPNTSTILTEENVYFKKLETLFKQHNIYKDPLLDREKVANKLEISTGYLSQLINTITNENFTTYVNKYRINAVKKMIVNPEYNDYSILSIGLESGFHSKTTFYKAFKKATGMTPNSYRKSQK